MKKRSSHVRRSVQVEDQFSHFAIAHGLGDFFCISRGDFLFWCNRCSLVLRKQRASLEASLAMRTSMVRLRPAEFQLVFQLPALLFGG